LVECKSIPQYSDILPLLSWIRLPTSLNPLVKGGAFWRIIRQGAQAKREESMIARHLHPLFGASAATSFNDICFGCNLIAEPPAPLELLLPPWWPSPRPLNQPARYTPSSRPDRGGDLAAEFGRRVAAGVRQPPTNGRAGGKLPAGKTTARPCPQPIRRLAVGRKRGSLRRARAEPSSTRHGRVARRTSSCGWAAGGGAA
jgi:hypothetical protein